jgi:two-component system, NtrC family, response regulator PilR
MQEGVLFISPSAEDANVLSGMLGPLSIPLKHAADLRFARSTLDREKYGVILTEARLADGNWEDVIDLVEKRDPLCAVVVTHPFADARFWADAIETGAYDVLAQPFCCSEVQRILSNALSSPVELKRLSRAAL